MMHLYGCIIDQVEDRTRTGRGQDEAFLSNRKRKMSSQVFPRSPDRNPTILSKLRLEFPAFPALVMDDPAPTDTTTFLRAASPPRQGGLSKVTETRFYQTTSQRRREVPADVNKHHLIVSN